MVKLGNKKVSKEFVKVEARTDGFVAVGAAENWLNTCRAIDEKIRRDGPWASARLPSFTSRRPTS